MLLAVRQADAAFGVQSAGGLVVEGGPEGARLSRPDGTAVAVALPAGGEVDGVADVGRGWLLTGTAPAPDGGRRLWLLTDSSGAGREIEPPAPAAFASQRRPVPLVERAELVGLAWLEGSAAGGMGVRAAAWENGRWSEAEWVARPGPGSQMALGGVVLEDGSWLLVWSAFDGLDDEVVSARRVAGSWDKPRRLARDNRVPDITPAVAATADGAVAAWSRYDGHGYSLVRALWDGRRWRELPGALRAGLYPEFHGSAASPALLFFDARRSAWTALELDGQGRMRRRAEAAGPASDEPPLVEVGAAGVRLRAPGSKQVFAAGWSSPQ
jgi:hypothetical protein